MTRRRLRPDEVELWRKVAETTQRLTPEQRHRDVPMPKPKPVKPIHRSIERFEIGQSTNGHRSGHRLMPALREQVAAAPLQMDKKTFGKLKRGKMKPEAKLDLHGKTLDQARPALTRFILDAQANGKRLVLVVTGKGKHKDDGGPIPTRLGVLRHNVPQWLAQPPLSQAVLQVSEAHLKHGGGGAYYVYLRRMR